MRLIFVRHGDPDYTIDSLTEKGHREAALLAEYLADWDLGDVYMSPLGRAKDTAGYTLRKKGLKAEIKDWLQEFPVKMDMNLSEDLKKGFEHEYLEDGTLAPRITWDMLPGYLSEHPEYLDRMAWRQSEVARCSDMVELYDAVTKQFDELLAGYGYVRDGLGYRVEKEYKGTITCFAHFGIISVLLSHLWNVSPWIPWQYTVLAPSSLTEVMSEERIQGIASFRATKVGDISHLSIGKEPPAFAARFCEVYSNVDERH